MKYLLIDGNNLGCRCAFNKSQLKNSEGISTTVHYGFMQSLMNYKEIFKDYQFLISWDGKSQRRVAESKAGVAKGLIKSGYKENREKEDIPQELKDFYQQAPFLKRALDQTGIPQIRMSDQETDDIIHTYCRLLGKDNEIVCVTGDEDFYQLLDDKVSIYNGGKQKIITKDDFIKEYEITPEQWVDVGALTGDSGDNIFGVYGVGEKTAIKLIKDHGTYKKVLDYLHSQLDPLRVQYPDIKDQAEFNRLAEIRGDLTQPVSKSNKLKYPEITINTPFTGVALALEDKKIKKLTKTDLMILMFEERVELAYSLKKMDIIPDLPKIKQGEFNRERLVEYFNYYDIQTLKTGLDLFKSS